MQWPCVSLQQFRFTTGHHLKHSSSGVFLRCRSLKIPSLISAKYTYKTIIVQQISYGEHSWSSGLSLAWHETRRDKPVTTHLRGAKWLSWLPNRHSTWYTRIWQHTDTPYWDILACRTKIQAFASVLLCTMIIIGGFLFHQLGPTQVILQTKYHKPPPPHPCRQALNYTSPKPWKMAQVFQQDCDIMHHQSWQTVDSQLHFYTKSKVEQLAFHKQRRC